MLLRSTVVEKYFSLRAVHSHSVEDTSNLPNPNSRVMLKFVSEGGGYQKQRSTKQYFLHEIYLLRLLAPPPTAPIQRLLALAHVESYENTYVSLPGALWEYDSESLESKIVHSYHLTSASCSGGTPFMTTTCSESLHTWDLHQKLHILDACAQAVAYLHNQGILHRNLASANFRLFYSGAQPNTPRSSSLQRPSAYSRYPIVKLCNLDYAMLLSWSPLHGRRQQMRLPPSFWRTKSEEASKETREEQLVGNMSESGDDSDEEEDFLHTFRQFPRYYARQGMVGTRIYLAPELLFFDGYQKHHLAPYSEASDLYALAIISHEVLVNKLFVYDSLFTSNHNDIMKELQRHRRPQSSSSIYNELNHYAMASIASTSTSESASTTATEDPPASFGLSSTQPTAATIMKPSLTTISTLSTLSLEQRDVDPADADVDPVGEDGNPSSPLILGPSHLPEPGLETPKPIHPTTTMARDTGSSSAVAAEENALARRTAFVLDVLCRTIRDMWAVRPEHRPSTRSVVHTLHFLRDVLVAQSSIAGAASMPNESSMYEDHVRTNLVGTTQESRVKLPAESTTTTMTVSVANHISGPVSLAVVEHEELVALKREAVRRMVRKLLMERSNDSQERDDELEQLIMARIISFAGNEEMGVIPKAVQTISNERKPTRTQGWCPSLLCRISVVLALVLVVVVAMFLVRMKPQTFDDDQCPAMTIAETTVWYRKLPFLGSWKRR